MIKVENIPDYAENYEFIVAREVGCEYFFWGAWSDREKANEIALELGDASVFKTKDCIKPKDLPINSTEEQWSGFFEWLRINNDINSRGFHMTAIEHEILQYEKQYLEAMYS